MKKYIIGTVILVLSISLLFSLKIAFEKYKKSSQLTYKSIFFNGLSFNYPETWYVLEKLTYDTRFDGVEVTLKDSIIDCSVTISCLRKYYSKEPEGSVKFYIKEAEKNFLNFTYDSIYSRSFYGENAASVNFSGYLSYKLYYGNSTTFIKNNVSVSVQKIAAYDESLLSSKEFELIEQSIKVR